MSARRTEDDDTWVPFLEVYRGEPPYSRSLRPGARPSHLMITAAVIFAVAVAVVAYGVMLVASAPMTALSSLFGAVSESNIVGHVPEPEVFDQFLTRDLESYFNEQTGKTVTVKYELLRDGPSQAGTAYPKYYAWVDVFLGSEKIQSGVVRVAAIDKAYFSVTHYFTPDDIRADPEHIRWMFGDDSYEKIEKKMIEESRSLEPSALWVRGLEL